MVVEPAAPVVGAVPVVVESAAPVVGAVPVAVAPAAPVVGTVPVVEPVPVVGVPPVVEPVPVVGTMPVVEPVPVVGTVPVAEPVPVVGTVPEPVPVSEPVLVMVQVVVVPGSGWGAALGSAGITVAVAAVRSEELVGPMTVPATGTVQVLEPAPVQVDAVSVAAHVPFGAVVTPLPIVPAGGAR